MNSRKLDNLNQTKAFENYKYESNIILCITNVKDAKKKKARVKQICRNTNPR